jgi:phosphoglycolate phosphatase-like HAD superfamily hydrolase
MPAVYEREVAMLDRPGPDKRGPDKLAVFDLDGTLLQSNHLDDALYPRAVLAAHGIEGVSHDWTIYRSSTDFGITREILETHWRRDPSAAEIGRVRDEFVALLRAAMRNDPLACTPFAGLAEFLEAMRSEWAVAIATGTFAESCAAKIAASRLDALDALPRATSSDVEERPDIIRVAIERAQAHHGVDGFRRTLYVGDGIWDLRAARDLGLPFLGVGRDAAAAKLRAAGATEVIADYGDAAAVLALLDSVA